LRVLAVFLSMCVLSAQSYAQLRGNIQSKEVQIAAERFSLGEPIPSWVTQAPIPEPEATSAIGELSLLQRYRLSLYQEEALVGKPAKKES
jgi:hypothetical protein